MFEAHHEDHLLRETKQIFDPEFKESILVGGSNLYLDVQFSKGKLLDRILKQRLAHDASGMLFPRNHKLFDIFNRKIQQLLTGGIINHFTDEWFKYLDAKRYAHLYPEGPKVLTMKHLEAGFVLWLVSISFAIMAFSCEWIIRLKNFCVMKCVLEIILTKLLN